MMIYSWGANTYGQLGQGIKCEEIRIPNHIDFDEILLNDLTTIEIGGNQSFLILKNGTVYGCGLNNVGQLGYSNLEECKFIKMDHLSKYTIEQLSCKWDTCYSIASGNICLGWGNNTYGQLGVPPNQMNFTREPIVLCDNAKQVATGLRHSCILLDDGKVITAGVGKRGQLGRVFTNNNFSYDFVEGLENVEMIACGQNFTIALTKEKQLLGWGCNKFGQLGLNPEKCQFTVKPVRIDIPESLSNEMNSNNVVIKCGWTHCLLLVGNKLFGWGRNNYGQLGNVNFKKLKCWEIIEIPVEEKVKAIAAGAEHNLIITENEKLMTWGWNEHGNCGVRENVAEVFHPKYVDIDCKLVKIIGAGSGHCVCLLKE